MSKYIKLLPKRVLNSKNRNIRFFLQILLFSSILLEFNLHFGEFHMNIKSVLIKL